MNPEWPCVNSTSLDLELVFVSPFHYVVATIYMHLMQMGL